MSTRDMHVEIDSSYKRTDGYKQGHHLATLVDIDRGSIRNAGDILNKYHQCGPLIVINYSQQSWKTDCTITFKYKKAYQQNSPELDYSLTFIGEWIRSDRYPTQTDYTESILEVGDYWLIGEDVTILGTPFKKGEFIICTIADPVTWVKGTVGWKKISVRGIQADEPIFSPLLDNTGEIAIFDGVIVIPAGTKRYTQHFFNSDFIYEITEITIDDSYQEVKLYALADNGMRLLYGFNTEYLRNIIEYLNRRYFPALDECPVCEGVGLVDGDECEECDGYKYIANPNQLLPDQNYDYLTDILAECKQYKKQNETYEAYRWKVWSKYWWKLPITEKIKEYIGHFLRINPESINIVKPTENSDGVIPECVWKIEIVLSEAGSIIDIETTDSNINQLVYDITPAGTKVVISRIIAYVDGDYDEYEDDYWIDGSTEYHSPNQLNYGCIAPDYGQDILSGHCVKQHFEEVLFSSGMNPTFCTYDLGASSGTSLIVDESLFDVNGCTGILYIEGERYDFSDYNVITTTFTLTSSLGVHTDDALIDVYYSTAENKCVEMTLVDFDDTDVEVAEDNADMHGKSGILIINGIQYAFSDFDDATNIFTIPTNADSHAVGSIVRAYYTSMIDDWTNFFYNVGTTDYIKYMEMDVPISIVDSSNNVVKWDDK